MAASSFLALRSASFPRLAPGRASDSRLIYEPFTSRRGHSLPLSSRLASDLVTRPEVESILRGSHDATGSVRVTSVAELRQLFSARRSIDLGSGDQGHVIELNASEVYDATASQNILVAEVFEGGGRATFEHPLQEVTSA